MISFGLYIGGKILVYLVFINILLDINVAWDAAEYSENL